MMILLIVLLGFIAVAAGMFGMGLGLPVRDTAFGAAVIVSASVAVTGGFILVGLAAAVSELRRALQAAVRQTRPLERWEAERPGAARRKEPRLGVPPVSAPETDDVIPARFDAPETADRPRQPARDERLPSDAAALGPAEPAFPPPPDRLGSEPRRASAGAERFDSIRPAEFRKSDRPVAEPEPRTEAAPAAAASDVKAPPLSPAESAAAAAIRPVRVLKSGTINDVSYTLFSDGSIETQTPGGTLRFGSIDEFRRHLEKSTS